MSAKKQTKFLKKRQKTAASPANRPDRPAAAARRNTGAPSPGAKIPLAKKAPKRPESPLFDKNNLMEIIARVFLLAMVFLFPLAIGPEKYANITHFKNSLFYVIASLGFCSVIVAMVFKVIFTPSDKFQIETPKLNVTDIAVLCYWGFLLISALLSPYKEVAFNGQGVRNDGFIIQSFYVGVYFVISHILRLKKFDLNIYCFGGTAVAALVMLHFFGIDVLETGFAKPNWETGLLFMGPMGNINLTSYFVTVALTLAAGIYITRQQLSFDRFGAVILSCFALMLWAELNLNTDAGIVAMGVVILVAMPLMLISFERVGRFLAVMSTALGVIAFNRLVVKTWVLEEDFGTVGVLTILAALVTGAAAALISTGVIRLRIAPRTLLSATLTIDGVAVIGTLVAAFFAAGSQKSGVLYELGQMLYHGNFNDHFGTNRLFTWKRTLRLAGKKPIFGSGPDSFCTVFNKVYGEESSVFFGGRNLDKAHNEYLQLLICSGITGLGAFLTFIGSLVARTFRRATDNPLLVCCGAAVVAYAVHAFFGYSLPINSPLMWVLFGLAGAAVRSESPDNV